MSNTQTGFIADKDGKAQFRTVENFFVASLSEDVIGLRVVFTPAEEGGTGEDVQFVLPKPAAKQLADALMAAQEHRTAQ